jgi:Na+/phosphate symporter
MSVQNYENHRQFVTLFHKVLGPVLLLTLIGAFVNLFQSWGDHERVYSASLIVVLTVCLIMTTLFARIFALKAQDRAIRAEENLRHFVMTGKLLDPRLSTPQAVGLRFASDGEFVGLAKKAADEGLTTDAIKRAVKNWRADTYRV